MKRIIKLGLLLFISTFYGYSQLSTHSPYTRYGIGEQTTTANGIKKALGGISNGYRLRNYIDSDQPASYTSQDTMSFILDLGIDGRYINYQTQDFYQERLNFYFKHISIGFPLSRWMKSSIGLKPYSYVGYNLLETLTDEANNVEIDYMYTGEGGINQFYIGNAIELNKKISIGVNLKYLFGSINHQNQIYTRISESFLTNIETKYTINNVIFDYGIQFYNNFGEKIKYTVGLTHNPSFNIKYKYDSLIYNRNSNLIDTLLYNNDNENKFKLPQKIGGGFAIEYNEKITFGFDFNLQNWTEFNFRNPNNVLTKSNEFKIGLAYIPNKYSLKRYSDHIQYRIGAHYSNMNQSINNNHLTDKGISFGVGLPFKNSRDIFNLAFEYGIRGTTSDNLIQENYFITTFNIILYDIWFFKRKID